jgi:TRAP-type C4-dicarboxylate transport system permease small subunit
MGSGRAAGRQHQHGAVFDALEQKAAAELGQNEGGQAVGWLAQVENLLVGGLAVLALTLCTVNVVVRFFYPPWTLEMSDEVQVYLIIWAVMLGLGGVTLADRHVKADLFVSFFPVRIRRACEVFGDLLGFGFALMLLYFGVSIAYESWDFGDVSTTSLRFPLWIYFSALPAGALMLTIGHLIRLVRRLRRSG